MKSIKVAKWCGRFVRCGYIWAECVMISWFSYRDGCCTDHTTRSITPWWPGSVFHYSWFCRIATCNFSMIECAITLTFVFPQMFLLLHCKISKTKTKEMISVLENVFTEWLERSHHDIHVIGGVLPSSWPPKMYIFFTSKLQLANEISVEKVIACFLSVISVTLKGHWQVALCVHSAQAKGQGH